jgi:hypothetical protein
MVEIRGENREGCRMVQLENYKVSGLDASQTERFM